jgi:AcrR family transcriptional regulator
MYPQSNHGGIDMTSQTRRQHKARRKPSDKGELRQKTTASLKSASRGRKTSFERNILGDQEAMRSPMATKNRILNAARHHFAEFGLAHASVRAITKKAGVNSAMLRYYFGSKKTLYVEVVHAITKRLVDVRVASLDQLRETFPDQPIPIELLLRSYAQPLFPRIENELSQDAEIYLRFFGRMYTEPSDELRDIIQPQFTDLQQMYIREIAKSVPYVAHNTIIFRFVLLVGSLAFLYSKVGAVKTLSNGTFDESDTEQTLTQLVTSYAALFRTPEIAQVPLSNGE